MTTRPARRGLALLASAGLAAGMVPVLGTPALAVTASDVDTVADGLNSPRGLAYAAGEGDVPDVLFVAEGGTGGDGPCSPAGDPEDPEDPNSPAPEMCYGPTGSITMITLGETPTQRQVVTELPSVALNLADGNEGIGPQDVSVVPGSYDGSTVSLRIVVGLGAPQSDRESLGEAGELMGTLIAVDVDLTAEEPATAEDWEVIADIAQFEYDNDPVPGDEDMDGETDSPDSNPHSVLALGDRTLVVDAGGNTMVSVDESTTLPVPLPGEPSYEVTLAEEFPTNREAEAPPFIGAPPGTMIPVQSVPTSVAQVADGPDEGEDPDLLVTELTGFPFPQDAANVYLVDEDPETAPEVRLSGHTNAADVAQRGEDLFVAEFSHEGLLTESPGAVVRNRPEGGQQALLLDDELLFPGGIVVDGDGLVYLTNGGILAGGGSVLTFDPSLAGDPQIAAACDPDEVVWPEFDDIEPTVHEEAIACLASRGVINGLDAQTYGPSGDISRAQAASLVARLLDETDSPLADTTTDFFDDDDGTHEANINRLAAAEIVFGKAARTYAPTLDVTRAELASLAVRAYEHAAGTELPTGDASFSDVSGTHAEAIAKAAEAGWINGYGDGTYGPSDPVSRAQAATILARALADLVTAGHAEP